ncbi:FtsX-like permease family protein [Zwartia sp.]|uniref:FtsX-like permease family protein n=1 Tax=Zwartia sp. TaxID=2978004 RepID=UPI0027156B6D|nr:FtsX-like permease family protein [Zwartia sp.]MDO9025104.1 FtsX-like permease family protein [Zwartia sp.]
MLFYWLLSSAFRAQPGRWLIAGLTVAIGIALAVAIHTVNRSALGEFGRAIDLVNGQASAQLVMPSGDFSDTLFDEIVSRQADLGIRAVSPVLERSTQSLRVLGLDVFQAARVTPALMPSVEGSQRLALFSKDAIFLSAAALKQLDVAVGDALTLTLGGKEEVFKVAGLVPGAAGQSLAVMDLGVAQWRLDGLGRLNRLDIQLVDGRSVKDLAEVLEGLNLGLKLVTADDRDRRMSNLSRAYRVNLSVLALVALFTGAFLVFTTISFSVLRQQSQLALLSVLGATRGWVFGLVLTQALIVAALGGMVGIGVGLLLASVLLRVVGGDLGGGYFSSSIPPLEIDGAVLLGYWLLSLGVGVLAGYFPARAATIGSPVAQLRAGAAERMLKPVLHYRVAVGLALISLVLAFMPPLGGLPIAAYLSIAFLLFAGLALTPSLVYQCFSFLSRVLLLDRTLPSSWTFAVWRLAQAPASAAGLIAGVVAALALTVAMVVMVASFRDSVTQWLDQVLPADLYASLSRSDLNQALVNDPSLVQAIASMPGIARMEFTLQQQILFRPDRPEVVLIARPVPAGRAAQVLPLTGGISSQTQSSTPLLPEVFVSEAMTDLYGWEPGQVHTLPITGQGGQSGGPLSVWVSGVFRDYGRQHGSIVMDLSTYQGLTKDLRSTDLALWLLPAASPTEVLGRLRAQFPQFDALQFRSSADLRALSLKIFDRSFALTYALEIAALLVAIFSVAAGFAGQALLRQKEFALMQHLGQSASQRTQWITLESGMLLGLAACWGTVLGLLMSQVLIHRVNPQSFHWTMQTSLPVVALIALMLSIVFLGIAAAVWASKRNLNADRLALSLREDW